MIAFDECEFIDSTAIAAVLRSNSELMGAGRRLVLCVPSPQVRRTLELVGLVDAGLVADDPGSVP